MKFSKYNYLSFIKGPVLKQKIALLIVYRLVACVFNTEDKVLIGKC